MSERITDHHDGHGLNELCIIEKDEPDHERGGGASHKYMINRQLVVGGDHVAEPALISAAYIQFQCGPRHERASTPGIVEAALLAVLIDRMRSFQAGPFACRENALVQTKLEEAMHWLKHRADARARRGVLGTLNK